MAVEILTNILLIKNEPGTATDDQPSDTNATLEVAQSGVEEENNSAPTQPGTAIDDQPRKTNATLEEHNRESNIVQPTTDNASENNNENSELPSNIFDEIAPHLDEVVDALRSEVAQPQPPIVKSEQMESAAGNEDETLALTPNFFDDMIPPQTNNVPLEELPEEELERKYSEKLREYAALTIVDVQGGVTQKRSQPTPDDDVAAKRARSDENARPQVRLRSAAELTGEQTANATLNVKTELNDENNETTIEPLQVMFKKETRYTLSQTDTKKLIDISRIKVEQVFREYEDFGRGGVDIPAALKKGTAIKRSKAALLLFTDKRFAQISLLHTATVRKLSTNLRYSTQQFYDNRSPLHTNNVPFAFSTPSGNLKLKDWGLVPLTPTIANITKVLGYDVHVLNCYKQALMKRLALQSKQKDGEITNANSLYCNAEAQTHISGQITKQKPIVKKVDRCNQTDFPTLSYSLAACVERFPNLKQMDKLNTNQLLALNDFAELMQQDDIAADVYRLRENLLRIYQRSRMHVSPVARPAPPPPLISHALPQQPNLHSYSILHQQEMFLAQQRQQQQQQQQLLSQQNHQQDYQTQSPSMQSPQQQHWQQQNRPSHHNNRGASTQDPRRRNNHYNSFNY